ncbi:MAG: sugar ABC transporter permease [Clostridia bacterium]|nr:sugar ABC transporter permease [Clostridia bacterium]
MQQNAGITLENGVVTIAAANGDFMTLTAENAQEAEALVDFVAAAASETANPIETLSLISFNKHRFTLEIDGASQRVEGFALTASGADVTVESLAQRENAVLTVSAADDTDGTTVLTITADNGDFVTLKTLQGDKAHAIAKAHSDAIARGEAAANADTAGETAEAVPAPVIKLSAAALPAYYVLEVYSDLGEPVTFYANNMISVQTPSFANTFKQVLFWTLIWAFFATFLNYFLGMLVAIMINKKGIKFKKLWRTILVMTIAIPQFISLLYVSKMFAADGIINGMLQSWGWIKDPLPFWTDPSWARVTIIGINIWIGIPYLMLIATGILMNIPADLYESARIDGANAFQTYRKITLPYMLFVTGPYLLTSFTGNINNFNVIFLLSQGKPLSLELAGNAGSTDLLITWLYKMTVDNGNYKLAAVIGILVFIVCAVINLIVYNLIPSVKNEEDFQ